MVRAVLLQAAAAAAAAAVVKSGLEKLSNGFQR